MSETKCWGSLVAGKIFIMDLGNDTDMNAYRYAAWIPCGDGSGRHCIAEVNSDLEKLKQKYHVAEEYVFRVQG